MYIFNMYFFLSIYKKIIKGNFGDYKLLLNLFGGKI